MPVSLAVNGQIVFQSDGASDKDVSSTASFPVEGYGSYFLKYSTNQMKGGKYNFNLKIPVMGADINKTFDSSEGLFVKMEFLPKGLSIAQATAANAF